MISFQVLVVQASKWSTNRPRLHELSFIFHFARPNREENHAESEKEEKRII